MSRKSTKHTRQELEWRELAWSDSLTPELVAGMLGRLATAPELGTIVLEFRATHTGARWLIGTQPHRIPSLKDALTSHLPVRLLTPRRVRSQMSLAAHLTLSGSQLLSSNPARVSATIRGLYGAVSRLQDNEKVTLQLILGRRLSPGHWRHTPTPSWLQLIFGPQPLLKRPVASETRDLHGFHAHVRVGADGSTARTRFLLKQVFGALRTVETSESRLRLTLEQPSKLGTSSLPWRWPLALRSNELSALTGWPSGEPPLPLLGSVHPRVVPPPSELLVSERIIGVASAPGHEARVAIPIRDAAFHTHLMGPTGSGKSTVMLGLIEADIRAGRGVVVLDPKGDLATDVLARIPKNRLADVVIIDPTHSSPVGFNPLASTPRMAPVTADTLLGIFQAQFKENWGIRTADVLSASFLDLARIPGANLLWLNPLLTDPAFRKRARKGLSDPLGTDAFWRQYDAKKPEAQAVEIAPVLNKLRQLILRPGLRAVLGQSEPRFDIGDVFTKKRILIVNLNRGRVGIEAAKLLGTLLMGQLWARLLARQALPEARRHIVPIYIDEVHDFLAGIPGDLSDALAQARSLGGAFTLANQFAAQLSPVMQKAIEANTVNKIFFGMNGSDAAASAKHAPGLEAQDFMLLPKYHAYANVLQDGNKSGWFSITTRPAPVATTDPAEVYAAAHERYGIAAKATEQQILDLITGGHTPDDPDDTDQPVGRVKR